MTTTPLTLLIVMIFIMLHKQFHFTGGKQPQKTLTQDIMKISQLRKWSSFSVQDELMFVGHYITLKYGWIEINYFIGKLVKTLLTRLVYSFVIYVVKRLFTFVRVDCESARPRSVPPHPAAHLPGACTATQRTIFLIPVSRHTVLRRCTEKAVRSLK